MTKFNIIKEIRELKNQISYSKKSGFFFGAGTSCALGVPNIVTLTSEVESSLTGDLLGNFNDIKNDLESTFPEKNINIEDILNHIRQIRSITGEREDKKYSNVSGKEARKLDNEICKKIYITICKYEEKVDLTNTKMFFAWLSMQNKDYSKEIFTSNYDLIIEKSLEEIKIPYFDGFVGSYEPFFWQESIESFVDKSDLTHSWLRLWKIHGSLSWFWKKNAVSDSHRIIRVGKINDIEESKDELVIYPSKEKYDSSKKQPFVAYFDRLKSYLLSGELLFVFTGYSFSDQHINEIILNSLRQNNRLHVLVFFFQDSEVEELYKISSSFFNLTVLGPKKAIVNGVLGEWEFTKEELKPSETSDTYWDDTNAALTLGDFNKLINFFIQNSGNKENIEVIANG